MKRFKIVIFTIVFLLLFAIPAFAQSGTCQDNAVWTFEGDTLTVKGDGYLRQFDPGTIIKQKAKHIVVEEGITYLYGAVFRDYVNVTDISLPDGLTCIGDDAFLGDTSLKNITIPSSVTKIYGYAFSGCPIENLVIPEGVKEIHVWALKGCSSLKTLTIPKSLESGSISFEDCDNLKTVYCYRNTEFAKSKRFHNDIEWIYLDEPSLPVPEKAEDDSFDESKAVQLTDYRYDNWARGAEGYNFFNVRGAGEDYAAYIEDGYFSGISGFYSGDHERFYNSAILKPDGTELFMQGKYSVNYCTSQNNDQNYVYIFPQNKNYFLTVSREKDKPQIFILDKSGDEVAKADSDGHDIERLGFAGFLDKEMSAAILGFVSVPASKADGTEEIKTYSPALFVPDKNSILTKSTMGTLQVKANNDKSKFWLHTFYYNYPDDYPDELIKYVLPSNYDVLFDSKGNEIECPKGNEYSNLESEYGSFTPYSDSLVYSVGNAEVKNIDKSYVFKSKVIGGKNYYALFKLLNTGESVQSLVPTEKPSADKADAITKAYNEKLLYNNQMCRFKDNISRFDYAILATEVFCKAKGKTVEQYISENNIIPDYEEFTDTDNVYLLLAQKLGILEPTGEKTLSPERGMSGKEADYMLKKLASLMGVNYTIPTEWANQTVPFSREQTYTAVYDIYEKAKV